MIDCEKPEVSINARWQQGGIGRFYNSLKPLLSRRVKEINPCVNNLSFLDCIIQGVYVSYSKGVFFNPGYNPPIFGLKNYIFTLHDLNHLYPEYGNSSLLKRMYYKFIVKYVVKKARAVVTVSEFTKNEIKQWIGSNAIKIVNVGNGVDLKLFNENVVPYTYENPYFIFVGSDKKHKNLERVLRVFASIENLIPNHHLIIVGNISCHLRGMMEELNLLSKIKIFSSVEDIILAGLYKGADLTIFPSLYEGFGLPVIESMAVGTPVVTSCGTACEEIAKGAAFLVDPYSEKNLKEILVYAVFNESIRQEKITQGLEVADTYKWENVSRKLDVLFDTK